MIATGERSKHDLSLANGTAVIESCEPVRGGGSVVGALIKLRALESAPSEGDDGVSSSDRATFGWNSLTESEHSVADLVAEGLTNREVATRLLLSRHTVDAHLRHIFASSAFVHASSSPQDRARRAGLTDRFLTR